MPIFLAKTMRFANFSGNCQHILFSIVKAGLEKTYVVPEQYGKSRPKHVILPENFTP